MVLPVTQFFSRSQASQQQHRPILNRMPYTGSVNASKIGSFNTQSRTFWRKFKQSPELYGAINILVTDIIGDSPSWTTPKGEPLGRNKALEAQRHWRQNRIKETLRAILFDRFITGEGYGWKAKLSDEAKTKLVKEALSSYSLMMKENDYNRLYLKMMQDEDLKRPKKFDYIPASTVQVESDNYDILAYVQQSNGITVRFDPKEVLHFRLNTLDGNVQGFSPVESLVKEFALLYFVKGNMLAYMQNGGKPDILFTMKNAQPNSNSFKNFQQQLYDFKQLENTHGNLLGTGEVAALDLSFGKDRDMEYQNLALWVLSNLLFALGIPINRVPFLIGKAATNGDSGGMAEAGYQAMISEQQDELEDIMNYQYFEEFGWHMNLIRHYKQDEVRDAQTFSMNADTVTKLQMIYSKSKKKLKVEKINELLNVSDEDLEEMSEEEAMMLDPGLRNQNMLNNNNVQKEPASQKKADTKRNVANASAAKGMHV